MVEVLDTIPVLPVGWTDLAELRALGQPVDANEKCMNTEKRENQELVPHRQTTQPIMRTPRRVHVKGVQGVDAIVVVTVVQDKVWLSISPPFTWEAIMEPGKVDEVISTLERARYEAKKVATARNESAFRGDKATRNGSVTQ
ncbi:MAG: hypothetical protein ACRDTH_07490 [Pseudonocardiaceae bacterium]